MVSCKNKRKSGVSPAYLHNISKQFIDALVGLLKCARHLGGVSVISTAGLVASVVSNTREQAPQVVTLVRHLTSDRRH